MTDCKKRWKNIRDTYDRKKSREREKSPPRKGSSANHKRRKWILLEKLSFLEPHEHACDCISNKQSTKSTQQASQSLDSELSERNQENGESDSQEPTVGGIDVKPILIRAVPSPFKNVSSPISNPPTPAPPTLTPAPAPPPSPQIPPKPDATMRDRFIPRSDEKDKQDRGTGRLTQKLWDDDDDIDLFFKSIAHSVKKLPHQFRSQAKIQTLNLLTNLEIQGSTAPLPSNCPITTNVPSPISSTVPSPAPSSYTYSHSPQSPCNPASPPPNQNPLPSLFNYPASFQASFTTLQPASLVQNTTGYTVNCSSTQQSLRASSTPPDQNTTTLTDSESVMQQLNQFIVPWSSSM